PSYVSFGPHLLLCSRDRTRHHRALHSFPTRRSSDLHRHAGKLLKAFNPVERLVVRQRHAKLSRGGDIEFLQHLTRQTEIGLLDQDRKSTRLNSSHVKISYAVFCLKKKKTK